VGIKDRLERLEARAKPEQPPPRSERRERAFKGLFRTLGELRGLVERAGPLPLDDPRARTIIQRHQRETKEKLEKGVEPNG
jgi:hypothetical protein